jgi:hypothetical protein
MRGRIGVLNDERSVGRPSADDVARDRAGRDKTLASDGEGCE